MCYRNLTRIRNLTYDSDNRIILCAISLRMMLVSYYLGYFDLMAFDDLWIIIIKSLLKGFSCMKAVYEYTPNIHSRKKIMSLNAVEVLFTHKNASKSVKKYHRLDPICSLAMWMILTYSVFTYKTIVACTIYVTLSCIVPNIRINLYGVEVFSQSQIPLCGWINAPHSAVHL